MSFYLPSKIFISLVLLFCFLIGTAQKITREQYIEVYSQSSVDQMKKYKIPASITLAQGILESNNGNSRLATKGKNHFGIKCHGWQGKKIYADDDLKNECFRSYKNVASSFEDHSLFLTKYKRYAFLFNYEITDYKSWSKGLSKAGYATNKKYADILIKIIEENKLYKYDSSKNNKSHHKIKGSKRIIYLHPNRIKYIIIEKEETFLKISKELDIRLWQLYKYNEIDGKHELKAGEKIFIQPKRNKAKVASHTVGQGETLRSIANLYGIKIKKIKKKNKTITFPIKKGDILKLK